ncbi:MAG: hypothetical protein KatS3mg040_0615 [Candidatus Kapaibacterium sp.]|nr:MAG: hypothetical protein KatS3mg040_0615 [Candidatus Kapabacteria bacterium]
MKRVAFLCCALISAALVAPSLYGQSITNYAFSYSTATFSQIYGQSGTTTTTLSGDDAVTGMIPIGFDFVYMGQFYSQVSASTNGVLCLGSTASNQWSNNLTSQTPRPIISAFWDDLFMTSGVGYFSYRTDGSAPNRVFTAEWYSVEFLSGNGDLFSYQVKLYEGSGIIEFRYRYEDNTNGDAGSASIGITAINTGSGNFLSVNSSFNGVSSTTETTTITTIPPSNTVLTFTPPQVTLDAPTNLTFTNVLPGQMTLNWQDNTSNEIGYLIQRSTDGTNYTNVVLTSPNATSYTATGLTPSTTYYWRIYAMSEGKASAALSGTQATTGPLLCGTRQIPSTNYPNIKAAIDSIYSLGLACSVVFELQSSYSSTSEPAFPLVFNGPIPGASSTNTVTFRPASGVSSVVIGASNGTTILDLNGVSWVMFDGRPGGTGTTRALTIANVSTTASAGTIRLSNGATNNTFQYCRILGATTGTSTGTIHFGSPGTSVGNRKNTFDNCNIGDTLTTTQPARAVYAVGTTTVLSDSNTISNCNIYNYFANSTHYGIFGSTGYTRWIITGNSFYQTTARTFTSSVTFYHIYLVGSTYSGGHTISGNYIGGTQPTAGGSQMQYNISTTTLTPIMYGIYCSLVTSTFDTTRIIGNVITNLYFRTASTSTVACNGIYAFGGNLIIQNNVVGSATATNAITLQSTTTSTPPTFNGIYGYPSSVQGFSVTISGNTVGGITMNAENTASGWNFIGINVASTIGAESYVTNNLIGSTSTANSINAATSATGTQQLTGINISASASHVRMIVSGNTVANLNNNGTSTGSGTQFIRGILINSGVVTVENNTVYNFTTTTLNSSTSFPSMALTGIAVNSTTQPLSGLSGHIVRGNVVHSLRSLNTATATASHWVLGMGINSASTSSGGIALVERNYVHTLTLAATPSSTSVAVLGTGMLIFGGATNIRNNMIRLGLDPNGNAVTGQVSFYGLYKNNASPTGIYHNSIYIGGSVASGAGGVLYSLGLFRNQTSTDEIRNNIVQVNRTTSSGTGYHVAIVLGTTTTLACDNNLFYTPGTGGFVGGIGTSTITLYQTLAAWRTGSGMDASSGYGDANFVNPNGSASTGDLHISTTGSTPVEGGGGPIVFGPAVTDDFDGQSRSSLTPIDIGADAGNFTVSDIVPPAIAFTPLTNGTVTSTRTVPNIIIIDGGSGVNTTSGTRPRLYFKKSTEANQYVGNTSTDNGWKWVEASNTSSPFTFVINYSLLTSALSVGDVIQYFFVAQDLASTPNVAVGGAVLTTQPTSVALTNANFPATPFYSYTIAQGVSGTITVGPTESLTSLTNTGGVFEYINNRVVTGNVTVLVTGDLTSETGTVALNAFAEEGAGAGTYTITIRPASGTSPTISGTNSSGGLLRFNSAQRVIIDGRRPGESSGNNLTIVNNASSGSIAAIHFMGQSAYNPALPGCAYDTVRFCTIKTGSNTNTSAYGIFIGGTSVGSAGYGNRGIVLSDNQVSATYYGVRIIGGTGFPSDSITIARNTIGGSGSSYGTSDTVRYRGIMATWVSNLSITDNAFLNLSPAASSGAAIFVDNISGSTLARNVIDGVLGYSSSGYNVYGIGLSSGVANTTVLENRINRIFYTAGGNWSAYGIDVTTNGGNANILLANNMISNVAHDYGMSTTWSTYGIRITSTGNVKVYHNSVFLRGSYFVPSSSGQSAALLINTSTANIDVRNNIFHNRMYGASGSKSYAIYHATNPSGVPIAALDYNNYDVSATAQGVLAYANGADVTSLSALRAAIGRDQNSQTVSVRFVDTTLTADVHLVQQYPTLLGTSAVSSSVSTDYDGETRTRFTMGADEVKINVTITTQPQNTVLCDGGTLTLSVAASAQYNDGISGRVTPTLSYQWFQNGNPIAGATNAVYMVPNATFSHAGSYFVRVYASPIDSVQSGTVTVTVHPQTQITQQPSGVTLCQPYPFILTVTASGVSLTYQWQRFVGGTWTDISGATSSTYSVASAAPSDSGDYRVVVSGTCGTATSNTVTVNVRRTTQITAQPVATPSSVCLGQSFSITVGAVGHNLTYQWRRGGTPISGATNATYTVSSATSADFATYDVVVTGTCGTVTSNSVTVTQIPPTIITQQPIATPSSLCLGGTFTLSVQASGANLTYQWRKAGTPITGATNSTYTKTNVQASDFGSYDVIVTGTCGSVTSSSVTVTLIPNTAITTQPTPPNPLCIGDPITIGGTQVTGGSLQYQWQFRPGNTGAWANISGATNLVYSKSNATTSDSGNYRLIVTGACGNDTSVSVPVTVNVPHAITQQPQWSPSATRCTGESATITVGYSGTVTIFQWQRSPQGQGNWSNVGSNSPTLTLTSIQLNDAGDYRVILTGPCAAQATSNIATLTVIQNADFSQHPQPQTLCTGGTISLSAQTIGTVVSYQWQRLVGSTWTNITGATSSSYTKTNATVADSGQYRLVIVGNCSATPIPSNPALVNVQQPFTITSQPSWPSTPVTVGQTVTLTVGYTGTANFQWQRDQFRNGNWVNVGTNSNVYQFTVTSVADSGNFRCIVTGPCGPGAQTTNVVSVYTCSPPTIAQQPQAPQPLCPGQSFTLSVQATIQQGLTIFYQWQFDPSRTGNWTNIAGATSNVLTKSAITTADDGNYRVAITSSCSNVPTYSDVVSVVVRQPITITAHPTSQTVCEGQNVTFAVTATGTQPSYQWFLGNAPINPGTNPTATTPTLQLTNVQPSQAGQYRCFVSGPCTPNGVFSNAATLTVNELVRIAVHPQSQSVCTGNPLVLSVNATGAGLAYQWRFNGNPISGATSATYTIANPTTANAGSYSVVVSGTCNSVTSNTAVVTVNVSATIAQHPQSQTVCPGATVSFGVQINSDATMPTFQWQKNGINITGNTTATSPTLVLTNVSANDAAQYRCVITTPCQPNGITSQAASLTVNPITQITQQPQSQTVCEQSALSLVVGAIGSNLQVQWYKNNTAIPGATGFALNFSSVQLGDAGTYYAIVRGDCGDPQRSQDATLSVRPIIRITSNPLQNQTVCEGATVTFAVTVSGDGPSYQWRKNGQPITGNPTAQTATLVLTNVTAADAGSYDCRITGTCSTNGVTTNTAQLNVNQNIRITQQPQNTTVCIGSPVQLNALVTGTAPQYQWYRNGQPIPGATGAVYAIASASVADSGNYDVLISGTCSQSRSAIATLSVEQPTSITDQPRSTVACVGSPVIVPVKTLGTVKGYQWYKDGAPLAGQNGPALIIPSALLTTAGTYWCVITGSSVCGTPTLTTQQFVIDVAIPTAITRNPTDQLVAFGATVTVEVQAEGTGLGTLGDLVYRWYKGGQELVDGPRITGAATSRLTIRDIRQSDLGTDYSVVVSGVCGTVRSPNFAIIVPSVEITGQPASQTVCAGRPVQLTIDYVPNHPSVTQAQISIQWMKNGQPLSDGGNIFGSQTATLRILTATPADAGDYTCVITVQPGGNQVSSQVARITVHTLPQITQQPQVGVLCEGQPFEISIVATGGGLQYQWQLDGQDVPGATDATVRVPQAVMQLNGRQARCIVRNECGQVTSQEVTLTVQVPPTITQQPPAEVRIADGETLELTVVAQGSALRYQWRRNGQNIPGATSSTYRKLNAQGADAGTYEVVVSNDCGSVTSRAVGVTIITSAEESALASGAMLSVEPMPVTSDAVVRYVLPRAGTIRLALYDAAGKQQALLASGYAAAGESSLRLSPQALDLPSGTYSLELRTEDGSVIRRLIVIVR